MAGRQSYIDWAEAIYRPGGREGAERLTAVQDSETLGGKTHAVKSDL